MKILETFLSDMHLPEEQKAASILITVREEKTTVLSVQIYGFSPEQFFNADESYLRALQNCKKIGNMLKSQWPEMDSRTYDRRIDHETERVLEILISKK
jgi:hypothetical protein